MNLLIVGAGVEGGHKGVDRHRDTNLERPLILGYFSHNLGLKFQSTGALRAGGHSVGHGVSAIRRGLLAFDTVAAMEQGFLMEWIFNGEIWIALATLAMLEIVLGIDNLVFISIAVSKLPPERRPAARKFGLMLACVTRILLLLSLAYLARMQADLFSLFGQNFSVRDLVLIGGGLFLLVKGTLEIHDSVEGRDDEEDIDD